MKRLLRNVRWLKWKTFLYNSKLGYFVDTNGGYYNGDYRWQGWSGVWTTQILLHKGCVSASTRPVPLLERVDQKICCQYLLQWQSHLLLHFSESTLECKSYKITVKGNGGRRRLWSKIANGCFHLYLGTRRWRPVHTIFVHRPTPGLWVWVQTVHPVTSVITHSSSDCVRVGRQTGSCLLPARDDIAVDQETLPCKGQSPKRRDTDRTHNRSVDPTFSVPCTECLDVSRPGKGFAARGAFR